MRFLLGLMLGAAAVVMVAEGVRDGDDWRARLEPAAHAIAGSVQRWLGKGFETSAALSGGGATEASELPDDAAARQPLPHPPDPRPPHSRRVHEPSSGEAPARVDLEPDEQTVAAAPVPEASAPMPEPDLQAPPVEAPPAEAPPPQAPLPEASGEARSAVAGAPASAEDSAVESPFRLQTVWVPFHSRLSARGFADRLMESLNHPFAVERQGPGRYQVVFPYADEPERRALLAQAAEATGLPL